MLAPHRARWQAFESAHASIGGAQYWHTYSVPAFFERLGRWLGADRLERCRQGLHEERSESPNTEGVRSTDALRDLDLDLAQREERRGAQVPARPVDPNAQQLPIPFLERGLAVAEQLSFFAGDAELAGAVEPVSRRGATPAPRCGGHTRADGCWVSFHPGGGVGMIEDPLSDLVFPCPPYDSRGSRWVQLRKQFTRGP